MAFDGTTISCIVYELGNTITGGRISKIAQPEKDELLITVKGSDRQIYRLLISANASLPLIYLTSDSKQSPLNAPNFCMLLRKHLNGAKITDISQAGFERVITIELEHLDELGDYCRKYLIIEMMGKHSNIIFCEKNSESQMIIIDSIKRINSFVSSVREVLPGRQYFIPNTMDKYEPYDFSVEIMNKILSKPLPLSKAIYTTLTGFSPAAAIEVCVRSGLDSDFPAGSVNDDERLRLYSSLSRFIDDIKNRRFCPNIVYDGKKPAEFAVFELKSYEGSDCEKFESVSEMLESYYSKKNQSTRISQKSYDLRKITGTLLERARKKLDIQEKQFKSTEGRDKYRLYGELLQTYGYGAEYGAKSIVCNNYYTGEDIVIPLDGSMSAIDNSKKYFSRYNKLKRTYEALTLQIAETKDEINHLESISNSLDIAENEADLNLIRDELYDSGYIKKNSGKKKVKKVQKNHFLHYVSSDGFDIYVGKNNYQNDELTFTNQTHGDWWFHSKGIAGSHVLLKGRGLDIPNRTFEEAGALAAYYSKGRNSGKVEIDYTEIQNVKKPKNSKPGFVVYYTNYSLVAYADISMLKQIDD